MFLEPFAGYCNVSLQGDGIWFRWMLHTENVSVKLLRNSGTNSLSYSYMV